MNYTIPEDVMFDYRLGAYAKLVYALIMNELPPDEWCRFSNENYADILGTTNRNISRALFELRDAKWIDHRGRGAYRKIKYWRNEL